MFVDNGLELLEEDDCWALLRSGDVGRVGLTMGAMPAIFPVNYVVLGDTIVFRTAPGAKLAAAADSTVVAFEVDDYERSERSGWSVLVIGPSSVLHDDAVGFQVLADQLDPIAEGVRSSIVQIRPEFLSGRRLVHESSATG
jgi:nitroimidazol reductase NimA-like FMN-containing flavoprotein (pyridoxamine 5'-phosphate oxidase superfamily)